jgi:hypothetical protein
VHLLVDTLGTSPSAGSAIVILTEVVKIMAVLTVLLNEMAAQF